MVSARYKGNTRLIFYKVILPIENNLPFLFHWFKRIVIQFFLIFIFSNCICNNNATGKLNAASWHYDFKVRNPPFQLRNIFYEKLVVFPQNELRNVEDYEIA